MSSRSLLAPVAAFMVAALGVSTAAAAQPRDRESFNQGWRFARFGLMPDGSRRDEPGGTSWKIPARASSEEIEKSNFAQAAFDGDPETRWCANGGDKNEWLAVDLNEVRPAALAVDWEFPELHYGYAVESSDDGERWTVVATVAPDRPVKSVPLEPKRHLRVRVTDLPDGKWASIRELRLLDRDGRALPNEGINKGEWPSTVAFDDSAWRALDLPHDWGVEGPFRDDLPNDTGKLPWKGIGWYRKTFHVPATDRGRRLFLDFDGAMANAQVYVNGRHVGGWPYGYQSFRVDATSAVKYDADNVVAVRLDTENWGSRWYPGAGIYRNVWLVKTSPIHVAHWGVFAVATSRRLDQVEAKQEPPRPGPQGVQLGPQPNPGGQYSGAVDMVRLAVTVENQQGVDVRADVSAEIFEEAPGGGLGAKVSGGAGLDRILMAGNEARLDLTIPVNNPKPWSLESPNRYVARVTVKWAGDVVDVYDQPFGFRTIEFTGEGFKLNGRKTTMQGTCNHHDLGPLGTALNVRALERQLQILKEMGCNALRTSHNPPAPELLDLADRMGFLVQVEAFDCWKSGKTPGDYASLFDEWHERDLQAMVRRDRNHPSVVMWSIGNEIAEQDGPRLAKPLAEIVRREDPTRPVTAGCNNPEAGVNGFQTAVDAFGLNYHPTEYARILDHPGNQDKPIYTSESSSCVSSRGEYFFPPKRGSDSRVNFQVSSYDVDAPPWAQAPDTVFEALDRNPRFFGEFVWTGFDYIGEPTPYNSDSTNLLNFSDPARRAEMQAELDRLGKLKVPSALSYFGIVDLCGFKKDRFHIYQARWRPDLPMAHILPHWNWPERVGQATPVHVYTSGDEAELFQDGESLGRKKKDEHEYRIRWDEVEYKPGELKVVAYKDGREWATDSVKTTGPAAKLVATVDRPEIAADGRDLAFVTVKVADVEGLQAPRAGNLVKFKVDGPGEIVAVGNGDSTDHDPFQADSRRAYNGLCLAIVRVRPGESGAIKIKAAADGLRPAEVAVVGK